LIGDDASKRRFFGVKATLRESKHLNRVHVGKLKATNSSRRTRTNVVEVVVVVRAHYIRQHLHTGTDTESTEAILCGLQNRLYFSFV